jgi:hypothetical protein
MDLVGLYLSAILQCAHGSVQVLTFVLCKLAADDPSIIFALASTSSCTLQNASHCIALQWTEDEWNVFFGHNHNASGMVWYSLCVWLLCHLIAGRGALVWVQYID